MAEQKLDRSEYASGNRHPGAMTPSGLAQGQGTRRRVRALALPLRPQWWATGMEETEL